MSLTNEYISLTDVKTALRIPLSDTVDDLMLESAINAASRQIDGACDRVFFSDTETRDFIPDTAQVCFTDDFTAVTKVEILDGVGGVVDAPLSDFQFEPVNGRSGGREVPFDRIRATGDFLFPVSVERSLLANEATVRVTGTFGFTPLPDAIKQAALLLSIRIFKRLDSPLAVAGFGDMGVVRVGRTDPDVMALIHPFVRYRNVG